MEIYLATYKPLCVNGAGKQAIERFSIPPFVDYSIRREPDFESEYPSITCCCRCGKFVPRIKEGDIIVYISKKGGYLEDKSKGWRFVAILKAIKKFNSHLSAKKWYKEKHIILPRNCIVDDNPPLSLNKTSADEKDIKSWDGEYERRCKENGDFVVCEKLYLNLETQPQLDRKNFV